VTAGTPARASVLLLDIEGTTTPMAYVHDQLFPYARRRLGTFLAAHRGEAAVLEAIASLRTEHETDQRAGAHPPPWTGENDAAAVAYLEFLMDRDRKSPGLKALQGLIWEDGYRRGDLHGELFEGVAAAMRRWHAAGKRLAIYSSGSVLAQRLLFSTTPDGDLTTIIDAFFDTGVGPKVEAESYRRIAAALRVSPGDILFLSDAPAEITAASASGVDARLVTEPSVFATV
jgi:enolase-phosphatase E1